MPEVPTGEIFYAVTDDKVARALAERRRTEQRETTAAQPDSRMSLDTLFTQIAAGEVKDFNIIVKADVKGSVEAVRQALEKNY